MQGLFFWAAYPGSTDDLSGQTLAVASISASLDGLATPAKIDASRPLLPSLTAWVVIEGGNHAQFGWYGDQPGDNMAMISREGAAAASRRVHPVTCAGSAKSVKRDVLPAPHSSATDYPSLI